PLRRQYRLRVCQMKISPTGRLSLGRVQSKERAQVRILVYPHTMAIGGSQLNAVQLAGAVRDRGHDVIVASQPGPLVEYVHALGLPHLYIPAHRRRPSFDTIRALIRVVQEQSVDVMHVYESIAMIEAFFGPRLR